MTRTFTDDSPTVDDELDIQPDDNDNELSDDFDNDDQVDDEQADDASDDNQSDDDDDDNADDETATAQDIWDNAVAEVSAGGHVDPAQFAADFAGSDAKDPHEKLNELNNGTAARIFQDDNVDMADKGMILGSLAMLVEAVHAILPDKKVSKGSTVDPKAVALDNATRLFAVRKRIDSMRLKVDSQLRDQAVVAGLVTTDDLDELDDNGDDFVPDLDTSKVTFTKKFGDCIDYIVGVPGKAKGTGAGAGEKFSPGQVRYDNKGNSCRFDGTHYFVTLKGAGENTTKFTSSSTAAKKLVTNGTEVNGLKHFRHHSDPTA